jgi:3-dehydroquinate synthase
VAGLYGERVVESLRSARLTTDLLTFPAGEANKTRQQWLELSDRMFALGCGRDSCVVALGGGVTGDLAGFVAATYMRGVPLIQAPTTLLAMIDASVGGKTGVDTPSGKNLIGAFHPPRAVLADTRLLDTLPDTELRSGLAEAVKHGAILDADYFDWITAHAHAILEREPAHLGQLVSRSVELKARVVAADPLEHGERAILNFGHTVGHALELHAAYGIPHGFAVAAGMLIEAAAGEAAGITAAGTRDRLQETLGRCRVPASAAADPAELLPAMRLDKKARGARARFVLLAQIGRTARTAAGEWTHELPESVVNAALRRVIRDAGVV